MNRLLVRCLVGLPCLMAMVSAQVLRTEKGRVEFVGLETWTPERIYTSLGYASLDKMHACAADLIAKLKFAEASVTLFFDEDKKLYTFISVVEPQHAARVERTDPSGSVVLPDRWLPLVKAASESFAKFDMGVREYARAMTPVEAGAEAPQEQPWWSTLRALNTSEDFEAAERALRLDRDPTDRLVAAAVLLNFSERDAAWHALAAGARDGWDPVAGLSYGCLSGLARAKPRKIDWKPAVPHLRSVLNGTNLFALRPVLDVLIRTEIEPALAKELVGDGGGKVLLPYLRAQLPEPRDLAYRFVRRLSGESYPADDVRWGQWLESLRTK